MALNNICVDCFKDTGGEDVCMHCGYLQSEAYAQEGILTPKTVLSKYIIGRVISKTPTSVLYKAYDRNLGRIVAVKEFFPWADGLAGRPDVGNDIFSDTERSEEFERKKADFITCAQVIRRCAHDNIVLFYDEFEANGTSYQVMEHLEGLTLTEYFGQVPKLGFEESLDVMIPVMEAMSVLHESGVLYRSFSPDNIFISTGGETKLFGFENIYIPNGMNYIENPIIREGFSAPEVYAGQPLTAQSDIYSLGALWYRLLTGTTLPAKLTKKQSKKLLETAKQDAGVPSYVFDVIFKALSEKPAERYATVEEFAASLRGEGRIMIKKKSKVPIVIAAILSVLIIVAGVAGVFFFSMNSVIPTKDTEITLWYPTDNNEAADKRWNDLAEAYSEQVSAQNKFRDVKVTVKTKGIDRTKYKTEITKALKDGTAPDLYCSDLIENNEAAYSLEKLYAEIDKSGTAFTPAFGEMRKIFEKDNKIAACYDLNVLYISTRGKSKTTPDKNASLDDLIKWEDKDRAFVDTFICAPDSVLFAAYAYGYKDGDKTNNEYHNLFKESKNAKDKDKNLINYKEWTPSDIINASTKFCIAKLSDYNSFYSSSEDFEMMPLTGDNVESNIYYPEVWSINGKASDENAKAAVYFLYYMLTSTEGQKAVSEVNNTTYYLPYNTTVTEKLNKNVYDGFINDKKLVNAPSAADYAFMADKAIQTQKLAVNKDSSAESFESLVKSKR